MVKLFFRNRMINILWNLNKLATIFIVIACITWWEGIEMLEVFAYYTAVQFTDQNWYLKTCIVFYDRIRCVMVCKIGFTNWNVKIALLRPSMVVTYYIKLFRTWADRRSSFLMSLLLLVAETKTIVEKIEELDIKTL